MGRLCGWSIPGVGKLFLQEPFRIIFQHILPARSNKTLVPFYFHSISQGHRLNFIKLNSNNNQTGNLHSKLCQIQREPHAAPELQVTGPWPIQTALKMEVLTILNMLLRQLTRHWTSCLSILFIFYSPLKWLPSFGNMAMLMKLPSVVCLVDAWSGSV